MSDLVRNPEDRVIPDVAQTLWYVSFQVNASFIETECEKLSGEGLLALKVTKKLSFVLKRHNFSHSPFYFLVIGCTTKLGTVQSFFFGFFFTSPLTPRRRIHQKDKKKNCTLPQKLQGKQNHGNLTVG